MFLACLFASCANVGARTGFLTAEPYIPITKHVQRSSRGTKQEERKRQESMHEAAKVAVLPATGKWYGMRCRVTKYITSHWNIPRLISLWLPKGGGSQTGIIGQLYVEYGGIWKVSVLHIVLGCASTCSFRE